MASEKSKSDSSGARHVKSWFFTQLRSSFLTGLSVLIPLYLTVYIVDLILGLGDNIVYIVPQHIRPSESHWFKGAGLLISLVLVTGAGFLVRNFLGRLLLSYFNSLMERIPIVASLYSLFRQISEVFLGSRDSGFKQAVLVEWPRTGVWTIGFVGSKVSGMLLNQVQDPSNSESWIHVFVPATPNPTSGFYFMVREIDTKPLSCSVEQAFKTVISGGVLAPDQIKNEEKETDS